jgi:hypothetical protein
MKNSDQATDPLDGITLVPEPSEELLNERQYLDYRSEQEQCLEWLLTFGKEPTKAEGTPRHPPAAGSPGWTSSTAGSGVRGRVPSPLTHEHADK